MIKRVENLTSTVSGVYKGFEWVFDLPIEAWEGAAEKVVPIEELVPAQAIVTVHGMASIKEMYRLNYWPEEAVLVVRTGEGYVIRDGHHRYVRAMLFDTDILEAKVLEDPR